MATGVVQRALMGAPKRVHTNCVGHVSHGGKLVLQRFLGDSLPGSGTESLPRRLRRICHPPPPPRHWEEVELSWMLWETPLVLHVCLGTEMWSVPRMCRC